jgi:hypothetical protein
MDIATEIKYPLTGEADRRLIIGGLLTAGSILVIPLVAVIGYYIECISTTIEGDDVAPELSFDALGPLLKQGSVAGAIIFAYFIAGVAIVGIGIGGGYVAAFTNDVSNTQLTLLVLLGSVVILIGLLLLATIPAALTNYATSGRFRDAFRISKTISHVVSINYLLTTILIAGIASIGGMVGAILIFIPIIGPVASSMLQFPITMLMARFYGISYRDHDPHGWNISVDDSIMFP